MDIIKSRHYNVKNCTIIIAHSSANGKSNVWRIFKASIGNVPRVSQQHAYIAYS